MKLSRFVLAGTQSGVGKTTITIGIMAALKQRGLKIQPFKVGPDYIDPAFHTFVTGYKSRNLDSWMLKEEDIRQLFVGNGRNKDMAVVEGVMGLYDGSGSEKEKGSTAHVAKIIEAPVILVINGGGISTSAAAQVLGYKLYDTEVNLAAIIINNVSGEKHYELLKEAIERDTGIPCIGYLKKNPEVALESRHLGLIPTLEVEDLHKKVIKMALMVEETIDVDALIDIAMGAKPMEDIILEEKTSEEEINIGVAYDKAFHFYYEDNLELLKQLGTNLIFFSPLEDKVLPQNLHGLYIGGGFPEVFGDVLEANESLRREIKSKIEQGMPTYAECGGLMYLTEGIIDLEGKRHEMVGVFQTQAKMTGKLQRFGYVEISIQEPCVLTSIETNVKGHEFHRSMLLEDKVQDYAYRVSKRRNGVEVAQWSCGLKRYHALGAYAHIHFYSQKPLAKGFVESCRAYKDGRSEQ